MMPRDRTVVTIFGSSRPKAGDQRYAAAYELGRALGEAGFVVCNGGYGGTMEASARGAKDAGGETIGITCKVFSRAGANPYMDRVEEAEDLFERLTRLIDLGQAYLVLPGGSGTLVELALVWELLAKRLMDRRPVILYGDFWKPVIELAARDRPHSSEYIRYADTPEEVVAILQESYPG